MLSYNIAHHASIFGLTLFMSHEPEESSYCLESMGYIESRAEEVITVPSNVARPGFEHISISDRSELDTFEALENKNGFQGCGRTKRLGIVFLDMCRGNWVW